MCGKVEVEKVVDVSRPRGGWCSSRWKIEKKSVIWTFRNGNIASKVPINHKISFDRFWFVECRIRAVTAIRYESAENRLDRGVG